MTACATSPVFACVTPHPPIIVPAVGRGSEAAVQDTLNAFAALREALAATHPDTLLVIAPHGPVTRDRFHVLTGRLRGDLRRFGAPQVSFDLRTDLDLALGILREAAAAGVRTDPVDTWEPDDHSTWVPLSFLRDAAPQAEVVAVAIAGLPPEDHYRFGKAIAAAIAPHPRRVAIIASADGSHTLREDGPYGFDPAGPQFEERFHDAFTAWDVKAVLGFDARFRYQAGEDSVPSTAILMGILAEQTVRPRILAAEGPWGVGYMTAIVEIEQHAQERAAGDAATGDAAAGLRSLPRLARRSVEAYARDEEPIDAAHDPGIPAALHARRGGAFVTIFADGDNLRGCIGTTEATEADIVSEVARNAVAAASRDSRFPPVTAKELPRLTYKVDLLTPPEPIAGSGDLDPRRYGVIVETGPRRGLLLPDLEGIDTADEQIAIAREKAGIGPREPVTLYRFEVERIAE